MTNNEAGSVRLEVQGGIATITFEHPKSNSLPGALLRSMVTRLDEAGENQDVRVVVIQSLGEKAFCAGASFDEFLSISTLDESKAFFSGFANVIRAIRRCPKFVVARVQGKVVGGGVGLVSACDYALATTEAHMKLSEIAIGIGPFIIGPAVERKVGTPKFSAMAIDAEWRSAEWCKDAGVYAELANSIPELDNAVEKFIEKLSGYNPEACTHLKRVLWEGTEHWDKLLDERLEVTAQLVLSDFAQAKVEEFKRG